MASLFRKFKILFLLEDFNKDVIFHTLKIYINCLTSEEDEIRDQLIEIGFGKLDSLSNISLIG